MSKKTSKAIRLSKSDQIMETVINIVMTLLFLVVAYPLVYVVSSSFSSGDAVFNGKVILWPVDFSTFGYEIVLKFPKVWVGYKNTIINTVLGTIMNVFTTTLVAYPLSRKEFQGKGFYMFIFMFTMWFGGGLVPTYILMSDLGLVNNRLAVLLTGLVSISNMVVMRSFFRNSIPGDLHDAARVDGISDIGYLVKIVLPLSKAIFSVVTLYYAVAHWNAYFSAMIYLRDPSMMTLQQVLKDLLAQANPSMDDVAGLSAEDIANMQYAADLMKYSLIVISSAPILCAYPFVQKYFERGVMIGSVKG
jgi:multiple sugar transport system permease protein/putative aldouronate transport system permease protein